MVCVKKVLKSLFFNQIIITCMFHLIVIDYKATRSFVHDDRGECSECYVGPVTGDFVAQLIICTRHLPNSSNIKRCRLSVGRFSCISTCARRHWHVAWTTSCVIKLNGWLEALHKQYMKQNCMSILKQINNNLLLFKIYLFVSSEKCFG